MLKDIKSTILCEKDKDFCYSQDIDRWHPCYFSGSDCRLSTFNLDLSNTLSIKNTPVEQMHKIGCNVLTINIPFSNNYGHILHDVIPNLLSLDKQDKYDKVIMSNNPLLKKILIVLKIRLSEKIVLIESPLDFNCNKITHSSCPAFHVRNTESIKLFKEYIESFIKGRIATKKRNRLIYYKRQGKDVKNGRGMSASNEKEIISLLKSYASDKNLDFTIFNGLKNGKTMPFIEQIKLFREASVVVGPHGSGLANTVWMDPHNNCRVCEFCSGPNHIIHGSKENSGYVKNYNFLYGGILGEFIDYNLIPFTSSSSPKNTSIDLNNLKKFLI